MRIFLNGDARELDEGATVDVAVKTTGAPDRGVAVAVDGEVVPRGEWTTTELHEDQKVEVLQAVQGG